MAVRSYLDQQIQNEAAARAAGAPVTRGSFTDIANREVGSGFVDRALGTIPANTPPPAPAFQQTFLSGLLAQLQSATPEQQQQVVSQFAPQIQGLLGPVLQQQQESGRDEDDPAGYNEDAPPSFRAGWGDPSTWDKFQIAEEQKYNMSRPQLPDWLGGLFSVGGVLANPVTGVASALAKEGISKVVPKEWTPSGRLEEINNRGMELANIAADESWRMGAGPDFMDADFNTNLFNK